MREVGYTSTKPHFTNSWVRKSLKYSLLSVYVRDAFRISTWSLSSGLCFQVCNSQHSLFFCWRLSNSVALLRSPLLDWGWIVCIRRKTSCTEPRGPYRATPNIYGRKFTKYVNILMIFGKKWIILTHTMYCCLLLQIYPCCLWLLLCCRDIYGKYSWCLLYMSNTELLIKAQLVISHKSMKTHEVDVGHFQDVERL